MTDDNLGEERMSVGAQRVLRLFAGSHGYLVIGYGLKDSDRGSMRELVGQGLAQWGDYEQEEGRTVYITNRGRDVLARMQGTT